MPAWPRAHRGQQPAQRHRQAAVWPRVAHLVPAPRPDSPRPTGSGALRVLTDGGPPGLTWIRPAAGFRLFSKCFCRCCSWTFRAKPDPKMPCKSPGSGSAPPRPFSPNHLDTRLGGNICLWGKGRACSKHRGAQAECVPTLVCPRGSKPQPGSPPRAPAPPRPPAARQLPWAWLASRPWTEDEPSSPCSRRALGPWSLTGGGSPCSTDRLTRALLASPAQLGGADADQDTGGQKPQPGDSQGPPTGWCGSHQPRARQPHWGSQEGCPLPLGCHLQRPAGCIPTFP